MKLYESAFALSNGDLEGARQISHDTVIANTGASRRSGVVWSYYEPAIDAQRQLQEEGVDIVFDAALTALCLICPLATLVIATVEVEP